MCRQLLGNILPDVKGIYYWSSASPTATKSRYLAGARVSRENKRRKQDPTAYSVPSIWLAWFVATPDRFMSTTPDAAHCCELEHVCNGLVKACLFRTILLLKTTPLTTGCCHTCGAGAGATRFSLTFVEACHENFRLHDK